MIGKIIRVFDAHLNGRWMLASPYEREGLMFSSKKEALHYYYKQISEYDRIGWRLFKYHPIKRRKK